MDQKQFIEMLGRELTENIERFKSLGMTNPTDALEYARRIVRMDDVLKSIEENGI